MNSRVLSTFLNELDGITTENNDEEGGVLVVVTCSSISLLDDALIRPGRLHLHVHLDYPTEQERVDILTAALRNVACAPDVDAEAVLRSKMLFRPSGSDIAGLCRTAVENALREAIMRDQLNDIEERQWMVSSAHFS